MALVVGIDVDAVRDALNAAAEQTAALVESIDDVAAPVPGLGWSVGEVARHLGVFCLPAFTDCALGREWEWMPYIPRVEGFHSRLTAANANTPRWTCCSSATDGAVSGRRSAAAGE